MHKIDIEAGLRRVGYNIIDPLQDLDRLLNSMDPNILVDLAPNQELVDEFDGIPRRGLRGKLTFRRHLLLGAPTSWVEYATHLFKQSERWVQKYPRGHVINYAFVYEFGLEIASGALITDE